MTHNQIDQIVALLIDRAKTEFHEGLFGFDATVQRFEEIHDWAKARREVAGVPLVHVPGEVVYVG